MRNLNSRAYRRWRYLVFKRDRFKCQMPDCTGKPIEAHHIVRWADSPKLRYDVNNGITLCVRCHALVTGQEQAYASMLSAIALKNGGNVSLDYFYEIQKKLDKCQDSE